jgi:hypothetical protein
MVIAAVEQRFPPGRRVITDELAIRFLPAGIRLLARACRWVWLRQVMINASEKQARALGGLLGRKRYAETR